MSDTNDIEDVRDVDMIGVSIENVEPRRDFSINVNFGLHLGSAGYSPCENPNDTYHFVCQYAPYEPGRPPYFRTHTIPPGEWPFTRGFLLWNEQDGINRHGWANKATKLAFEITAEGPRERVGQVRFEVNEFPREVVHNGIRKAYSREIGVVPIPWVDNGDTFRFLGYVVDNAADEIEESVCFSVFSSGGVRETSTGFPVAPYSTFASDSPGPVRNKAWFESRPIWRGSYEVDVGYKGVVMKYRFSVPLAGPVTFVLDQPFFGWESHIRD